MKQICNNKKRRRVRAETRDDFTQKKKLPIPVRKLENYLNYKTT